MKTNWDYRKIGDVCTVERGGSPRPIDDYITDSPDGINWIKIGDTSDSMFITQTAQKIIPEGMKKSRYVQPGDFLLSNSMSFGRPYILKIDGCIHDGWLVLRDNDEVFDKRFLYYYLSAKPTYAKFKSMAVGGVVNNLNSEMVRKVEVPIPEKVEQAQIADLLDIVNAVILRRKQQLSALDDLIKARFVEMFGGCKTEVLIGDVVSICRGASPRPIQAFITDTADGVNWIKIGDVSENSLYITQTAEKITQDGAKKSRAVHKGDFILSNSMSFGRPYILGIDGCVHDGWLILSDFRDTFDELYLYNALRSEHIQHQFSSKVNGATVKNLNSDLVKSTYIQVPSMNEQRTFADFCMQVDKSKVVVQKALDETQVLFDSLMQQYFG